MRSSAFALVALSLLLSAPRAARAMCNDNGENDCCVNGHICQTCCQDDSEPPAPEPTPTPTSTSTSTSTSGGTPPAPPPPPPPPPPPVPTVTMPSFPLATCPAGGSDCRCADALACDTPSPFFYAELGSIVSGGEMLASARKSTDLARQLVSNGTPVAKGGGTSAPEGGTGPGARAAGGAGTGAGAGAGAKKQEGQGANAAAPTDTSGGAYASGAGKGKKDGDDEGTGGSGRGGGVNGSSVSEAEFGAGKGGDASASGAVTAGDLPWAKSARKGFDPDDSDTWTQEEKDRLLKEALEMDPDRYFRFISVNESIFERLHKRYRKIDARWAKKPLPVAKPN